MALADHFFYFPDRRDRCEADEPAPAHEDVFFETADGLTLHGWRFAAAGARRGTVLHLHGNAANVTAHYRFVEWLPRAGYEVLTFDYRGYGRSAGRISREGSYLDAEAALRFVQQHGGGAADRPILFGQSIGGAIGVELAARHRGAFRAVVLDSAFGSYRGISAYHVRHHALLAVFAWWFPFCVPKRTEPIEVISSIGPTPLLMMHGTADRIVPIHLAQELFAAAGEPKSLWLAEGMGHMEVWFEAATEARRRFTEFVAGVRGARGD